MRKWRHSARFYIEPYPKSKAFEFHDDSITSNPSEGNRVIFQPFVGIGPRRFFELFSMSFSAGFSKKRKDKDGTTAEWKTEQANMRMQMLTINKEVQSMKNEPTMLKKDIHWQITECEYVVRNVLYLKADFDGEELLDMDVSIAVTTLRDLMVENAIPHDVNYDDFADIEF